MRSSIVPVLVVVGLTLAVSPAAHGQSPDANSVDRVDAGPEESLGIPDKSDPFALRFSLRGFYAYQLSTDMGDDGKFDVNRLLAGFTLGQRLTEDIDLSIGLDYSYDFYSFNDTDASFGGEPWSDVQTISTSARFTFSLSDTWILFAGPLFEFSQEPGADAGDSWMWGAFVGAAVRFSDDLLLGFGVGAIDQLDDPVDFFPQIIIDWIITSDLRLTSRVRRGGFRTGVELVWEMGRDWDMAIGGTYDKQRSRLADDNQIAPNGVGEDKSFPLWWRLSHRTDQWLFTFWAGLLVNGKIEVELADGSGLVDKDYDAALLFGLSVRFDF